MKSQQTMAVNQLLQVIDVKSVTLSQLLMLQQSVQQMKEIAFYMLNRAYQRIRLSGIIVISAALVIACLTVGRTHTRHKRKRNYIGFLSRLLRQIPESELEKLPPQYVIALSSIE